MPPSDEEGGKNKRFLTEKDGAYSQTDTRFGVEARRDGHGDAPKVRRFVARRAERERLVAQTLGIHRFPREIRNFSFGR